MVTHKTAFVQRAGVCIIRVGFCSFRDYGARYKFMIYTGEFAKSFSGVVITVDTGEAWCRGCIM